MIEANSIYDGCHSQRILENTKMDIQSILQDWFCDVVAESLL